MLTKLGGTPFALNADLIETIEKTPDTTVRLTTKQYYVVKESMDEVFCRIIEYHRECNDVFARFDLQR